MLKVRQSYVKCSCIVLDDKAMITSDPSIYRALNGTFDVLKTSNENIFLNGFSCGFIGGASGVVDNTILFCGDIRKHKDYNNILFYHYYFPVLYKIIITYNCLSDFRRETFAFSLRYRFEVQRSNAAVRRSTVISKALLTVSIVLITAVLSAGSLTVFAIS